MSFEWPKVGEVWTWRNSKMNLVIDYEIVKIETGIDKTWIREHSKRSTDGKLIEYTLSTFKTGSQYWNKKIGNEPVYFQNSAGDMCVITEVHKAEIGRENYKGFNLTYNERSGQQYEGPLPFKMGLESWQTNLENGNYKIVIPDKEYGFEGKGISDAPEESKDREVIEI